MNRSNVGNVITNGMQILSVGAVTGSKVFNLGKADSALNNMSTEQKNSYYKMKADKMIDETNQYNSGGQSATQHLSEDELTQYREFQADNMRKQMKKSRDGEGVGEESVDDFMADVQAVYKPNSEQIQEITTRLSNDNDFLKFWKNESTGNPIDDLINKGEI